MPKKDDLENKALLEGLVLSSKIGCASVWNLANQLSPSFKGTFKSKEDFRTKIDDVSSPFSKRGRLIGEKEALGLLILKDIKKIKQTLNRAKIKNPVDELHADLEIYKKTLNSHGIDFLDKRIFIVDSLPPPYTDPDCVALNCDSDDERKFGIPPGIYFQRPTVAPFFSSRVLAHELVHASLSKVRSGRLARGLEDGLCDLVGLYLSSKTLGYATVKNILINLRSAYPLTQTRQIYAEALRQAIRIYQIYGLKGLFQILERGNRKGRTVVKKIEKKCILGEYSDLGLDKGGWTPELDEFSDYFIGFPASIVASPLACYLAERIKVGDYVKEAFKKYKINPRDGRRAIKQLEGDLYLIVTSKGRIVYDETKTYVKTGTLRYVVGP